MTRSDRWLIAGMFACAVVVGLFAPNCPTGIFHPTDKATSDDARAQDGARGSDWISSSSPPHVGAVDAEVAPTTPAETSIDASASRDVRASAGVPLSAVMGLEPGFIPSAEALYDYTVGTWQESDFLDLTVAEASRLVPEVGMDATLPTSLASLWPLPTREDCERAWEDPAVAEALTRLCVYDVWLFEAQDPTMWCGTPKEGPRVETINRTRELRDDAEEKLWEALDRASSYKDWRLWGGLFRAWIKEPAR